MTKEIIYKSPANSWTEQLPHTLALPQQNLMLDLEWKKIVQGSKRNQAYLTQVHLHTPKEQAVPATQAKGPHTTAL